MTRVGSCSICGRLYNLEERGFRIRGDLGIRTSVMFFIRSDGAGRKYPEDIQACPECSDKVYTYIKTMNSEVEVPEYIPSGHSS